jgi:hypothetical protein
MHLKFGMTSYRGRDVQSGAEMDTQRCDRVHRAQQILLGLAAFLLTSLAMSADIPDQGQLFDTQGILEIEAGGYSQSITVGIPGQLTRMQFQLPGEKPTPSPKLSLSIVAGGNPPIGQELYSEVIDIDEHILGPSEVFTWELTAANLFFKAGEQFTLIVSADAPGLLIAGNYDPGYEGGELYFNGEDILDPLLSDLAFITFVDPKGYFKQKEFVFSIPQGPATEAESECNEGIAFITKYDIYDIKPTYTGKWRIATIRTWDRTGKVIDNDVNDIGEILVCQDWQTYWPQRNLVPVYYEITIGGRKYRAAGAGTSPNFPQFDVLPGGGQVMVPEGYPEYGVTQLNYSATVLPATSEKVGGSFNIGNLGFVDGTPSASYDHYSIGVLRITVPITASSHQ